MARHGSARAGRWLVQLRYPSGLTSDDYISQEAWREATLECCPLHPQGGCSFRRHTPYERKVPPGARVARWYCREGHCTFSLLPDCLAARLSGTLVALEAVVALAEKAPSLEAAANDARTDDVGLVGAMRWTRRRREQVHANLLTLKGLMPERFVDCAPSVAELRRHLGTDNALMVLRNIGAVHLHALPAPLGFLPGRGRGSKPHHSLQHHRGPDPPTPPPITCVSPLLNRETPT